MERDMQSPEKMSIYHLPSSSIALTFYFHIFLATYSLITFNSLPYTEV